VPLDIIVVGAVGVIGSSSSTCVVPKLSCDPALDPDWVDVDASFSSVDFPLAHFPWLFFSAMGIEKADLLNCSPARVLVGCTTCMVKDEWQD
jgi:hypothetical protein